VGVERFNPPGYSSWSAILNNESRRGGAPTNCFHPTNPFPSTSPQTLTIKRMWEALPRADAFRFNNKTSPLASKRYPLPIVTLFRYPS